MKLEALMNSYCINSFFCENPVNPINADFCLACGAKLLIGNRYRLIELLDKPNARIHKRVYGAIDTQDNDKRVVLKIIDYPDEELASYLEREYKFLQTSPPPFIRISEGAFFDWLPDQNNDFYTTSVLVLPWIEGKDSLIWIKENGAISEARCIDWILQIIDYLEVMSDLSMMHRDIKPENIIVCPDGNLQLIDFETVRAIDEDYVALLEGRVLNEDGSARTATRLHSFAYSAPEQSIGRSVLQSDFYALGKTAILWISGKTPGELIEEEAENWADICNVSQTFERFINCLTASKVSGRPLNARAIRQYLEERYPVEIEGERLTQLKKRSHFKYIILAGMILFGLLSWGGSEFFLLQAKKSISAEDYDRAISELQMAGSLNPFSDEIVRQQAYARLWNNDSAEAKQKFEQALKRDPTDAGTLYHLGILNEKLDEIPLAQEFYQRSLEAEPIQIEAQMRLARIALRKDEIENAENYLNQVLETVKKYPNKEVPSDKYFVNFYLGWLNFKKRNFETAYSHLETALFSTTHDPQYLSVTTGDIVCLLAETATFLDKKEAETLWVECFMTSTRTEIGTDLRQDRMREFIKNSTK